MRVGTYLYILSTVQAKNHSTVSLILTCHLKMTKHVFATLPKGLVSTAQGRCVKYKGILFPSTSGKRKQIFICICFSFLYKSCMGYDSRKSDHI